jgi:hypothetical protein
MAVIIKLSMWHISAIPWKAAYGPHVKNACVLNEKTMSETKLNGIIKGIIGYEAYTKPWRNDLKY